MCVCVWEGILLPAMPWSPWVGTPRTPPLPSLPSFYAPPPSLATTTTTPPPERPTPSWSSPRTEVSFQVAMEMSHGRNVKGGEREGRAGGQAGVGGGGSACAAKCA